jgi:ferredoxin
MRVVIDRTLCQGHGQCAIAAPENFTEPGADGRAQVIGNGEVIPADEDGVRNAAVQCPEAAVLVTG